MERDLDGFALDTVVVELFLAFDFWFSCLPLFLLSSFSFRSSLPSLCCSASFLFRPAVLPATPGGPLRAVIAGILAILSDLIKSIIVTCDLESFPISYVSSVPSSLIFAIAADSWAIIIMSLWAKPRRAIVVNSTDDILAGFLNTLLSFLGFERVLQRYGRSRKFSLEDRSGKSLRD